VSGQILTLVRSQYRLSNQHFQVVDTYRLIILQHFLTMSGVKRSIPHDAHVPVAMIEMHQHDNSSIIPVFCRSDEELENTLRSLQAYIDTHTELFPSLALVASGPEFLFSTNTSISVCFIHVRGCPDRRDLVWLASQLNTWLAGWLYWSS
jgi:hypothetical protein